jgi:hypothetical protein
VADDALSSIEHAAAERLDAEAGRVEADLDAAADDLIVETPDDLEEVPANRLALAMLFPVAAAAVMVGGIFSGASPRVYAILGGVLGMGLGLVARRIAKPLVANVLIAVGLFAIGLVIVIPTGVGNVTSVQKLASDAAASGDVLRPPVDFVPGWQAIVGWLMGIVGFGAVWLATVVRKPSLALLVPLPVAAIAGISVPENAQVPSGIVVLVLFAIGLGLLSSARQYESGARVPLAFEIRKQLKSLPIIGVITVALIALAQTSFLFPQPKINPADEPQKPKTIPLDEVEDRVLFEVRNPDGGQLVISGPWRLGTLDVYDGEDWRLAAFSSQTLEDVPKDGVIDGDLTNRLGVKAEFKVLGLGGAALPALPSTALVVANGPKISFDPKGGALRVASGQAAAGTRYTVGSARLPTIDELRNVPEKVDKRLQGYLEIPPPPPAVQALLAEADQKHKTRWDKFDFLRSYVLNEVTASGPGVPTSITPDRVQEILGDTKEASPFEIVALQAMLARWVGVPGRIGYGFDGGEVVGDALQVRPKNGASFVEVYFGQYKWLPVIGVPKKAKPTVGSDPKTQQFDDSVLPSNNIAVQIFLPKLLPPRSTFLDTAKRILAVVLVAALIGAAVYISIPAIRKARIRGRRRAAARRDGPRARIALAYAEWRDFATDFGYGYGTDTPLMYLDRFVDDPEHAELAWLTTRAMWGDLREECTPRLASAAEELSRAMRRRLSQAQPATMRFVASVSRLSLKAPYAPETDLTTSRLRYGRRQRDGDDAAADPATTPPVPAAATISEREDDRVPSRL